MPIQIGDKLPAGKLMEFIDVETPGCPLGPNTFDVAALTAGKKVVLFGLPGAFTPTCSAKHVPGYVTHIAELKAKGVDEVFCISVNDPFVMGAWGKDLHAQGKVRMMADGLADYVKALGLEQDIGRKAGLGIRAQRFSLLVEDGVVKQLNIDPPGSFGLSSAETILKQLG